MLRSCLGIGLYLACILLLRAYLFSPGLSFLRYGALVLSTSYYSSLYRRDKDKMNSQPKIHIPPLHHAFLLSLCFPFALPSSAWIHETNRNTHPLRCRHRRHSDHTIAKMFSLDQVPEILQHILIEPEGQAALLDDLAEVSSDIALIAAPETVILRLSAVIEKILQLTSNYLPEQSLRIDELAINIPILTLSVFLFSRSASPIFKAQFVELDDLDLCAYELCFEPVGITLVQFKCMKATGCFDIVDCPPGKVLIDENENYSRSPDGHLLQSTATFDDEWKYLYWQIDGSVIRSFRGNVFGVVERTYGKHIDDPDALGLLGDTRFLINLEAEERAQQRRRRGNNNNRSDTLDICAEEEVRNYNYDRVDNSDVGASVQYPIATITIGSQGARLLRINSHLLYDLMDHDERLESSIRLLLLKSLKRKIGSLLIAQEKGVARAIVISLATERQQLMLEI